MQDDEITRLIAEVERLRKALAEAEETLGSGPCYGNIVRTLGIIRAALSAPVQALKERERPVNCRNRLRAEGKPYPKSGCTVCKTGGLTGCPYERAAPPSTPSKEG